MWQSIALFLIVIHLKTSDCYYSNMDELKTKYGEVIYVVGVSTHISDQTTDLGKSGVNTLNFPFY